MMAPRYPQIPRMILSLFLVTFCLLGRIAAVHGAISPGCAPNSWGPLAPPSRHWVFNEPISRQTKLVTVKVLVLDGEKKPVSNADVLAYCEPWDFITGGRTDALGQCRVTGPIGDYGFCAVSDRILAASRRATTSENTSLTLAGTNRIQIAFVRADGSSFGPAGQGPGWCWFSPTNLPSPVGPMSNTFVNLQNGQVSWLTTPEIGAVLALMQAPGEHAPGYIVFYDLPTSPSSKMVIDNEELGCVRFHLDGLSNCETWWNFFFVPVNSEIGAHWVWAPRVSSTGGKYEIRVTPGLYRVHAQVFRASDWAYGGTWVPSVLNVEPKSVHDLQCGGTFEARIDIITWHPGAVHLWFDILDNHGRYLGDVGGTAHLRLKRGSQVLFDGGVEYSGGRYIAFGNPLADSMKEGKPVEFEFLYSSPILGILSTGGVLPRDREMRRDAPLVGQSSHFELHSRDPAPYADGILGLMECAYDWLAREYSGPFSPQTRERFDLHYEAPVAGWSSGDLFCTSMYSGYDLTGDADQTLPLYHEFVHTCLSAFLGELWKQGLTVRPSIHELSESQANVVGMYLARAIHGERTFRMHRQYRSNQFFSALATQSLVLEADRYIFPWLYIDARYGQAVNRDFFRAVYANEHNLGAILETMDFLKTESERTATLHSYLASDNLAWLYRWAGFQVSDKIVDQGVAYLKAHAGPSQ